MAKFRVEHDRPNCIGCAACAAVFPEGWEMNSDGKSDLIGAQGDNNMQFKEMDDLKNHMEAANSCPVNVIHVIENGKKLI